MVGEDDERAPIRSHAHRRNVGVERLEAPHEIGTQCFVVERELGGGQEEERQEKKLDPNGSSLLKLGDSCRAYYSTAEVWKLYLETVK